MRHPASALIVAFAFGKSAHAQTVVFSTDFNADAPGANTVPGGFHLTRGNTEVLGTGDNGEFFDVQPGNGYYVSLVGTGIDADPAGLATDLTFDAGDYALTFDLTGNSQGATDETVTVGLGSFSESVQLAAADFNAPFQAQTFFFTSTLGGALTFSTVDSPGETNDQLGALIDNVVLTSVPEPATAALLAGVPLLITRRRRR